MQYVFLVKSNAWSTSSIRVGAESSCKLFILFFVFCDLRYFALKIDEHITKADDAEVVSA